MQAKVYEHMLHLDCACMPGPRGISVIMGGDESQVQSASLERSLSTTVSHKKAHSVCVLLSYRVSVFL